MFICSIAVMGNVRLLNSGDSRSSTQWQLSASYLLMASNIFDHRAWGWGSWIWTAEGHPPNGGGDCVHVCNACCLIPHNAACAHRRYPGGHHHPKGHGTQEQLKGHLHQLWCPQAGHHPHKAAWQSWWLHKCQCLYWQRGFGWGGSLWQRCWRLYW